MYREEQRGGRAHPPHQARRDKRRYKKAGLPRMMRNRNGHGGKEKERLTRVSLGLEVVLMGMLGGIVLNNPSDDEGGNRGNSEVIQPNIAFDLNLPIVDA